MEIPTDPEFTASNFKALLRMVEELASELASLKEENSMPRAEVPELKNRPGKGSHNSSEPPSADGLMKKAISLRRPTGKKPTGQPGHEGDILRFDDTVDKEVYYSPEFPCRCGSACEITDPRSHYVADLPGIKPETAFHHTHSYRFPGCGPIHEGPNAITRLIHENIALFGK